MKHHPLRRAFAQLSAAFALGLLALSAPVASAQTAGPALWVVRDADSTLYLFGTVHVLRETDDWGSPAIDAAFDSAATLVLEIDNPEDQAALIPLVQQHGLTPDRPLSSLLTADEVQTLDTAAQSMGLSAARLDPMRPWLAALQLAAAPLANAGYDPGSGVDAILRRRAAEAGLPVMGFETLAQQVGILAGFPEEGQLAYLRRTLNDYDRGAAQLDRLIEAWSRGDTAAIETIGLEPIRAVGPRAYQTLIVERNIDWADQIQTLLDGAGVTFVAVGALHLTGEHSVQSVLEARGVPVERVP